jgi:hypothetical protein
LADADFQLLSRPKAGDIVAEDVRKISLDAVDVADARQAGDHQHQAQRHGGRGHPQGEL